MQLITTTELRTRSKELVATLLSGRSVDLIHHSRIVGKVRPVINKKLKTIDGRSLQNKLNKLPFSRLTPKEIDRRYRIAMMKKHGPGVR